MKFAKYIFAFIIGLLGAGIAFSGLLGIFENIVGQINFADLVGDILTVAIGLYLLIRICLQLLRNEPLRAFEKIALGVILAFVLLIFLTLNNFRLGTNTSNETASEWALIETRNGDLTVLLPRNPLYEVDDSPDAIDNYVYSADQDGVVYIVKYENYSIAAEKTDVQLSVDSVAKKFLKELVDSTVEDVGISNFSSEFMSVKNYPAIRFGGKLSKDNETINIKGAMVLVGKSAYSFMVLYKDDQAEDLSRVLDSVSFNSLGL